MPEQINLTSPDQVSVGTSDYRVVLLSLVFEGIDGSKITIGLISSNGYSKSFSYNGQTAHDLIVALNTANLSTKSLQRRILERLIADGKLAGTISGTIFT